jgi:hypothetical protein
MAMADSIIDYSRLLDLDQEVWRVEKIVDQYIPPTDAAPLGSGRLELPPWQREWAWKNKTGQVKMRELIDSVFYNYPIPPIFLLTKPETHIDKKLVNDARHRIETLWKFKNNKFSIPVGDREIFYKDLNAHDARLFNNREIPVIITSKATEKQKREIFRRLNSGQPLANKDFLWMAKDSPLVSRALVVLEERKERLRACFGIDVTTRDNLPNWIAVAVGVTTGKPGKITTSFKRLNEHLEEPLNEAAFRAALDAILDLYSRADMGLSEGQMKPYAKIGNINAFFLADWMEKPRDRESVFTVWLSVLALADKDRKKLLKVSGAQNLNDKKILTIRERVEHWVETEEILADDGAADSDSDSDD